MTMIINNPTTRNIPVFKEIACAMVPIRLGITMTPTVPILKVKDSNVPLYSGNRLFVRTTVVVNMPADEKTVKKKKIKAAT